MSLWTILVPTLGQRSDRFLRLMGILLPQTEPYGGQVTVLALWNNGERPLPVLRDELMGEASSAYTSFADDDDLLPPFYVSRVVPLLDGTDYVGWRMQMVENGVQMRPAYHSLRWAGWREDMSGYYHDISHLNPVRRELALAHAWFANPSRPQGFPEDTYWADQLRGHLRTENYVGDDVVMYWYQRDTSDSTWLGVTPVPPGTYARPRVSHPNFRWHPASST